MIPDLTHYSDRINYHGPLQPNLTTLQALHLQHMLTVPFENLDIHLNTPIVLEEPALFNKLVHQGRGGFCYEQNGLFAAVLRHIGFEVTLLEARVRNQAGGLGRPFDHLALMVTLEGGRWLVDVGFGDSFLQALDMNTGEVQSQYGQHYRVRLNDEGGEFEHLNAEGEIIGGYRFSSQSYRLSDFKEACHYQQTSAESHFTQKRICSLARTDGRISLTDDKLIITQNGNRHEQPIADETAFQQALKTYFNIALG